MLLILVSTANELIEVSMLFCRSELAKHIKEFRSKLETQPRSEPAIVVFYYSGHGLVTSSGELMMMSLDWDSTYLNGDDSAAVNTGYPVEGAMKTIMAASPGCHLVTLLDTCRQRTSKGEASNKAPGFYLDNKLQLPESRSAVVIGYACNLYSLAEDGCSKTRRNSVYTSFLLQVSTQQLHCLSSRQDSSNWAVGLHALFVPRAIAPLTRPCILLMAMRTAQLT
jgi:hypothetical protein